ncbi:hypothetical protein Tco_0724462 [Tanacetum coccineum]
MYEAILVSCVIDKLSLFWKDFKHTLKHKKGKLTLVKLGIHLRIEKSLRAQEIDKPQSNNVAGILVVNMVELNNSTRLWCDDYEGAPVFDDDYEEAPVFDDDQFEEESVPVYDTDIEDVIEEEEGFVGK